jgi:para-nitrobenzyl esterase
VGGLRSGTVEQFLGIRYATAERFAAPVTQPLGAGPFTTFGCRCPQVNAGVFGGEEDCLFLNVYRPSNVEASERLPVLFWIHGGSFMTGAGSDYDPSRLVETNRIIVVTVNYRLGPLGFLALAAPSEGGEGLSGEYGLQDQQEALRWVRANIATFGGDPGRVTIAGESAGGAAVCAQISAPSSVGLFAQAIIQSASCAALDLATARAFGAGTASAVQCADQATAVDCLRGKTPSQLTSVAGTYGVVAGGAVLPQSPEAVLAAGVPGRVPVMVGSLRDEIAFFAAYFPDYFNLTEASYGAALQAVFPAANFPGVNPADVVSLYPLEGHPAPRAFFAISAVASDSGYFFGSQAFIYWQALGGCVTSRLADTLSRSTATFAYELDDPEFLWNTTTTLSPLTKGASHTSDLPFLFELGAPLNQPFGVEQNALADAMVRAWGAFVNTGDPSTPARSWPGYNEAARNLLHLEPGAVGLTTDFNARHHCAFWRTALNLPPT